MKSVLHSIFWWLVVQVPLVWGAASPYPPMLRGMETAGYGTVSLFTFGEGVGTFVPVGTPDGLGAFALDDATVRILVNHEVAPGEGYDYALANGTRLRGARISRFDIHRDTRAILAAGPAYGRVMDRSGSEVDAAGQINESGDPVAGLSRLCSAFAVTAGAYGFVDDLLFSGEETDVPRHRHGGTQWVLDVRGEELWAAPELGRGTWENVAAVEPPDRKHVALLMGDDAAGAPLYLWIGLKDGRGDGGLLDRNGLVHGTLYVWVPLFGDLDPATFRGGGEFRLGRFLPVPVRDAGRAGSPGYDAQGFANADVMRGRARTLGAFRFSRPEDLHTNPSNGLQAVFASTGRGALYPQDDWGTVYRIGLQYVRSRDGGLLIYASVTVIYDGDDLGNGDAGLRSPDNLVWAADGSVYVQEDRSTMINRFGVPSGMEASIWRLDPDTGVIVRAAVIDRTAVAPEGVTDRDAGELGAWESSGIIDVTGMFPVRPGEQLYLLSVQAHGLRDGVIARRRLVEGGQLVWLTRHGASASAEGPTPPDAPASESSAGPPVSQSADSPG